MTSRSPSPSRSNGCELMGTMTRASSCSTQASPSSGSSGIANHDTGCVSVVPRAGFCPPLFAATTSSRPSSLKSARKTRMYDPRSTSRGRNDPLPRLGAPRRAGVLEVDEVRELAGHDDVGIAVAVHVADGHVLGRARFLALGQRVEVPGVGVDRSVRYPHVPVGYAVVGGVGLVHGDDVQVAVEVEVGHGQAVAAPRGRPRPRRDRR